MHKIIWESLDVDTSIPFHFWQNSAQDMLTWRRQAEAFAQQRDTTTQYMYTAAH